MTRAPSLHVLIIGAGLGGLTLAQSLREKGISFEIFERNKDNQERPPGYAIGIHGIFDDLKASTPNDMPPIAQVNHLLPLKYDVEIAMYSIHHSADGSSKIGVRDGSGNIIRANRARLRDWLSTHIPIQYSKRAVNIVEDDKCVTVYFEDGSSATGDVVVGAEGPHSIARKHIVDGPDPLCRNAVGAISCWVTLRGEDMEEQLRLGHSCYVIDLSPTQKEVVFLFVGLNRVLPDGKSGQYYYHLAFQDENAAQESFWTQSAGREQMRESIFVSTLYREAPDEYVVQKTKDLQPRLRAIVDKSAPEGIRVPPLRFWTLIMDSIPAGRVTLLGDAAHSMTPFRGEGGYHAMRDALNLGRALARVDDKSNVDKIKEAMGEYQREMLARGSKAAQLSNAALEHGWGGDQSSRAVWGQLSGPLPEDGDISL